MSENTKRNDPDMIHENPPVLHYRLPALNDESALKEYIREHHEHGEQSISASLGLPVTDYEEWVRKILTNASDGDPAWGKSLLYLCIHQERIVGLLSIRYDLPGELSARFGDIGYGVRPTERRKGYATEMLRYALQVCAEKGLQSVILGCYRENTASASVIRKCGGVLFAENDNYRKGKTSQYYTVDLSSRPGAAALPQNR